MTRDLLQNEAVGLFREKGNLLLLVATGVGKTKIMLDCVEDKKCLFVIEKLIQEQNVREDALKFGRDLSNYTFTHYMSLHKYIGQQFDIIAMDEVDRLTPVAYESLIQIDCKRFLMASAEVNRERMDLLKKVCKFHTFKVSLSQAIKWNILPLPVVNLVGLKLDSKNRNLRYKLRTRKDSELLVTTYPDKAWNHKGSVEVICSETEYMTLLEADLTYLKSKANWSNPQDWSVIMTQRKGLERKQFFNQVKLRSFPQLEKKTRGKRRIFFFGNVVDCPAGFNLMHSADKDTKGLVDSFNREEIDTISSIGQLTRAVNLTNIEDGILFTLASEKRDFIQKAGRILRSEHPTIWIPYVKGTKDEKTIEKLLSDYVGEINYL